MATMNTSTQDKNTETKDYALDFEIPRRAPMAAIVEIAEGAPLSLPNQCACCGGQADRTFPVKATQSSYYIIASTTRTLTLNFPICQECKAHSSSLMSQRYVQVIAAAAAALVLVRLFTKSMQITTFIFLGQSQIIAILFFLGIAYLWPFRSLSADHCTRGMPVSVKNWTNQKLSLVFWSTDYAAHFANINGVDCREWKPRFHNLHDNAYRGWAGLVSFIWLAILVFFGDLLITFP